MDTNNTSCGQYRNDDIKSGERDANINTTVPYTLSASELAVLSNFNYFLLFTAVRSTMCRCSFAVALTTTAGKASNGSNINGQCRVLRRPFLSILFVIPG